MDYKYGEDVILAELQKYVESTYSQHYATSTKQKTQLLDQFDENDPELIGFLRISAIKYLQRYGKKDGHNKKDLMKAIHFTILLNHFTESKQ